MAKQPPAPGFPATATATIELRGGRIVVVADDGTEDRIRVAAGGIVDFVTPADSPFKWWSIVWADETPFQDGAGFCGEARGRRKPCRISGQAHGGGQASKGYKFAVVASDGSTVHFRDPEVIVGPGAGGG